MPDHAYLLRQITNEMTDEAHRTKAIEEFEDARQLRFALDSHELPDSVREAGERRYQQLTESRT